MSTGEAVGPQAPERLAAVAASVPSPFNEQVANIRDSEYECLAKAIGERLAASVLLHSSSAVETPSDLLEAITATAGSMLPIHNPNRSRFLDDEMAVGYAMHVYTECVDRLA